MKTAPIMAILAAGLAVPAHAEVVQSSPEGFVVTTSSATKVHPDEIWQALMQPANWWNGEHSWSLDAANFTLDPVAGGCFCETLPDGGSVQHMQVIMAQPGKMLRMSGALGPLQSEPLDGVLTIEIRNEGSASEVVFTYVVGGYSRLPLEQIAPAVDMVIAEQAGRLGALLFMGDPDWVPGKDVEMSPAESGR